MGGIATKEVQDDLWSNQDPTSRYQRTSGNSHNLSVEVKRRETPSTEKASDVGDPDADDTVINPENYDPKTAGPIFPNGEINWDCPCLGGAAHGPCGTEFREAFSCFHYSKDEVKGSDCFPQFREMHECFSKYPELYGPKEDTDELDEDDIEFDEEELKLLNEEDEPKEDKKDIGAEPSEERETSQPSPTPESQKKRVVEEKPREPLLPSHGGTPAFT